MNDIYNLLDLLYFSDFSVIHFLRINCLLQKMKILVLLVFC